MRALHRVIVAKTGCVAPVGGLVAIIAEPDEELPPTNQFAQEATRALPRLQPEKAEKIEKPRLIAEQKIAFSPPCKKTR